MKLKVKKNESIISVFVALCLLFSFSANLFAQSQSTGTKPTSTASQQVALVTEFDVNGLKVLVKRRPNSPTVSAGLFISGGVRNVTAQNAGVEGLMLDVMSEASAKFPREKMRVELSRMGTSIGAGANYDYSTLSLTCTKQNFDRSWEMFTDVALNPSFTTEDVKLIRDRRVIALNSGSDDPDNYLQQLQEKFAYAGHPYVNDPAGTPETIAKLTAEDLRAFHKKVMQTSQLLLVIVGDIDAEGLKPRIVESFGKLPQGNYIAKPIQPLSFNKPGVEVTQKQIETNYIQGLFVAPSLKDPDFYAMRVAISILGERVFTEVRRKRNLSYAPDAFLRTQGANVGGIYVTTDYSNLAVKIMLDEVERLKIVPIDKGDLDTVTGFYLTTYYLGQETNAAQAGKLAEYELIGGGWRNSFQFLEGLRAVKVEDVQRVANKYMKNFRFVVVGDPKSVDQSVFTSL